MLKLRSLFLFILVLSAISCKKEETEIQPTPDFDNVNYENPQLSGNIVSIDVSGRVVDNNGSGLESALVEIGSQSALTDENGLYAFKDVKVDEQYAHLKVTGGNNFVQHRNFVPATDRLNIQDIRMVLRQNVANFDTETGAQIALPGNGIAIFESAPLLRSNGEVYDGDVKIFAAYYDPVDPLMAQTIPGSYAAVNNEGELQTLVSYGMYNIELESTDGDLLQLNAGEGVTLKFPIQEEQLGIAPETIPLWFIDENTGIWREDGEAVKEGNEYVGEVTHFTPWNVDVPLPASFINGRLKLEDALGYANLNNFYIKLVFEDGSFNFVNLEGLGHFSSQVPSDELISLYVGNYDCQAEVFVTEFSVAPGEDLALGELDIPSITIWVQKNLEAQFFDCDGNMPNNVVCNYFTNTGNYGSINLDDGILNLSLLECPNTEIHLSMTAYQADDPSQIVALDTSFNIDGGDINIGDFSICDEIEPPIEGEHFWYNDGFNHFTFGEFISEDFGNCYHFIGADENSDATMDIGFNPPLDGYATGCINADLAFENELGQWVEVTLLGVLQSDVVFSFDVFSLGEVQPSGSGFTDIYTAGGIYSGSAEVRVYESPNSQVEVGSYVSDASGSFYHEIGE